MESLSSRPLGSTAPPVSFDMTVVDRQAAEICRSPALPMTPHHAPPAAEWGQARVDSLPGMLRPPAPVDPTRPSDLPRVEWEALSVDMNTVMALFQQTAIDRRATARTIREQGLAAQIAAIHQAADAMRTAANMRLTGAIVANGLKIASGMTQAIMAANFSRCDVRSAEFQRTSSLLSVKSHVIEGMVNGTGGLANAALERTAATYDIEQKKMEAAQRMAEATSSRAEEIMQQMLDIVRDTRERVSALESARQDATRSLIRNI